MTQLASLVADQPRVAPSRPALPAPPLVAAGLLGLAHLPMLIAHGKQLWMRPHYQFYPLVLAGAALLAVPAVQLARAATAAVSGRAKVAAAALVALDWVLLVG